MYNNWTIGLTHIGKVHLPSLQFGNVVVSNSESVCHTLLHICPLLERVVVPLEILLYK